MAISPHETEVEGIFCHKECNCSRRDRANDLHSGSPTFYQLSYSGGNSYGLHLCKSTKCVDNLCYFVCVFVCVVFFFGGRGLKGMHSIIMMASSVKTRAL